MVGRDDPYERDGPYRDGSDPRSTRPRRATRPAWDALTYGRPDDVRPPLRTSGPYPPYGPPGPEPVSREASIHERPTREPSPEPGPREPASRPGSPYGAETDWTSRYGPPPVPPSPSPPAYPASSYPAASPAYPAASPSHPASMYPAATDAPPMPESYAPETYTSYRAAPAPPGPSLADEAEPVYVASGLPREESPSRQNGTEPGADRPAPPGDASAYPGGVDEPSSPPPAKGGRNLPAAIAVGVGLGAVALGSLFLWRPAFLGLIVLGMGVGVWELVRALQRTGANPPLVPLLAGGLLMTGLAWWGGPEGLTFGLVVTIVAVMVWRFAHGTTGYATDVTTAALIAVYVPFLAGFMAMLARPEDGHLRVVATLIAVVLTDTGGYVVGARFGRHPMAPSVSPKKSWEGLGGSLGSAAVGSAIVLMLLLDVPVWWGLVFGLAVAAVSVVGDLAESMVKRAIGIKDMSGLLPGHGGAMDRLDSLLFTLVPVWVLLSLFV